jgi:hypothetical protein
MVFILLPVVIFVTVPNVLNLLIQLQWIEILRDLETRNLICWTVFYVLGFNEFCSVRVLSYLN